MSRRPRARLSSQLPRTSKPFAALVVVAIVLTLVLVYRGGLGDRTASFVQHMTHNPDLVLPDGSARTLDALDGGIKPE